MDAQFSRFDFDARMHDHHVTEKQQQMRKINVEGTSEKSNKKVEFKERMHAFILCAERNGQRIKMRISFVCCCCQTSIFALSQLALSSQQRASEWVRKNMCATVEWERRIFSINIDLTNSVWSKWNTIFDKKRVKLATSTLHFFLHHHSNGSWNSSNIERTCLL